MTKAINYESPMLEVLEMELEQGILNDSTTGGGGFGELIPGEDL